VLKLINFAHGDRGLSRGRIAAEGGPLMAPILSVSNLVIRYGALEALKGVSLSLEEGEVITVLGANGAGKSTLLRAISGLLPMQAGEIRFLDAPSSARRRMTSW
jgi:branched-chain amino acid transport system ATP-binding protein